MGITPEVYYPTPPHSVSITPEVGPTPPHCKGLSRFPVEGLNPLRFRGQMQRALDSSLSAPGPAHRTAPQRTAPQRTAEMTFVRWFFSLAIAPFVYASAEAGASEYTYQHEGRTCRRCPPGQYMKTRCTRSHDTICAPCSANHYTQYWNYIQKCQYCNNFCQENQYVKSECNQFHNRVCECKDGYFWKYEFCMKHKECPQGFGVTAPGTPHEDTVCTKCHPGFFSSVSSATMQCKRHTNCTELGLELDIVGTTWHDNLCTPCQPSATQEGISECEEALFNFVHRQHIRQKKMLQLGKALTILTEDDVVQIKNDKQQTRLLLNVGKMKRDKSISAQDFVKALREVKLKKIARKVINKFLKKGNNELMDRCGEAKLDGMVADRK